VLRYAYSSLCCSVLQCVALQCVVLQCALQQLCSESAEVSVLIAVLQCVLQCVVLQCICSLSLLRALRYTCHLLAHTHSSKKKKKALTSDRDTATRYNTM